GAPGIEPNPQSESIKRSKPARCRRSRDRTESAERICQKIEARKMPALPGSNRIRRANRSKDRSRQDAGAPRIEPNPQSESIKRSKPARCRRSRDRSKLQSANCSSAKDKKK
ncbi:MAG: hypothetical protein K2X77_28235, partial [Candidatus Obscuribacterales bacterium]|nr:hypothetical protein [Candidatus Obscuribacterales bacterium]